MSEVCRNIASDVAAGRLSREDVDEIIATLSKAKKSFRASEALEGVEAAIMDQGRIIAEEVTLAAAIEKRNRLRNIIIEKQLLERAEAADRMVDNPALGLFSAMAGINAPIEGAQLSVDGLSQGMRAGWMGGMIADLKKSGVMVQYLNMKGDLEREVAEALSDLNTANPVGVRVSADAMKIARVMQKYQRVAMERQNRAGAYIRNKTGYIVRQQNNPERMAGKRAEWKAEGLARFDFAKMGIDPADVDRFLDSAYDAITSGVRLTQQINDLDRAFTGPGNLAKKISSHRVIEFKSANDWLAYDKKFGAGSLREAFQSDLDHAAQASALMTVMGTNPQAMLDRVRRQLEEKYRAQPDKLAKLRGGLEDLDNTLAEVDGSVNHAANHFWAKWLGGYRAIQTMAKLGGAWVSALTDIGFMATNRTYQGRSMMQSWQDAFSAPMEGLSGGDKRDFADLLGAGLEGMLGDFMSRFNASDTVPGRTSKLMRLFFKMNLLGPWTDANKRGISFMISRDLAMNGGRAFADLPEDLRRLLTIYGLDARKWEVARMAVKQGPDGRTYMVPGEVDNVRGAPFTGMTQGQQDKLRMEVKEQLFTLITNEADFAVPSPGARERAIMRRGYRPGTWAGEGVRFVGQFKSFGVTGLTKVAGRQVYGKGARTMRAQLARGLGDNIGLVNAIAGTTVLGFFVMQAKEVMKGRDPRPLTPETFIAAMLQGGGLGIYGDFLFGQATRYGGGTLETLAGPGIGTASDVIDLLQRARGVVEGGKEDLRGDLLQLVKSNIPFANLFYVKGALDYLLWYQLQEALNPGYLRRMERRVKRENNQGYWLSPSSIVARGGGFK